MSERRAGVDHADCLGCVGPAAAGDKPAVGVCHQRKLAMVDEWPTGDRLCRYRLSRQVEDCCRRTELVSSRSKLAMDFQTCRT
jgi:hypothetical protein